MFQGLIDDSRGCPASKRFRGKTMYGTQKEICQELNRMFEESELLAIFVWTTESIKEIAYSHVITDEEAERVLGFVGNIPMKKYQDGVSFQTIMEALSHVRTEMRPLEVPADLLSRLSMYAERALEIESDCADFDRIPISKEIIQGREDLSKVKKLLGT
ncbi:hypothetical protein C9426_23950 [Serratia sp. S1B]|nr:hypothetical protein C9426_23950 [Serratia sp. S1B]